MLIRTVVMTAALVAYASLGGADELDPETVLTSFERGGKVMWTILLCSVIGCAFAAERFLTIRKGAQIPKRLMADLRDSMVSGGVSAGLQVVEGNKSAMGRVMYSLLSRSGATRRELETTVDDEGSRILYDLRANLRPIGIIASIAPLLGLLGTVFGLIAAFRQAAELGMDDPRNFAAGIYEALYTTAFGLVVAIPMSIIYHMLRNRADNIMREVEERALAFISAASNRAERATRSTPAVKSTSGQLRSVPTQTAAAAVEKETNGTRADTEETSVDDE